NHGPDDERQQSGYNKLDPSEQSSDDEQISSIPHVPSDARPSRSGLRAAPSVCWPEFDCDSPCQNVKRKIDLRAGRSGMGASDVEFVADTYPAHRIPQPRVARPKRRKGASGVNCLWRAFAAKFSTWRREESQERGSERLGGGSEHLPSQGRRWCGSSCLAVRSVQRVAASGRRPRRRPRTSGSPRWSSETFPSARNGSGPPTATSTRRSAPRSRATSSPRPTATDRP